MASVFNAYNLLEGSQAAQDANRTKGGKKKKKTKPAAEICGQPAPSPQPVETSQAQPELESVSQDGFLPAKKGSGKPKMARTDSSREQPPSLSEELKQSCTAAHTAEDWQHLYASWQTQLSNDSAGGKGFRKTFMNSNILEKSAVACCTHPDLQAPLAALLEAALSASANTLPHGIAAAVSQLGLALRGQPQEVVADAHRCVGAALGQLKNQDKLQEAASAAPSEAALADLEASVSKLASLLSGGQSQPRELSRQAEALLHEAQGQLRQQEGPSSSSLAWASLASLSDRLTQRHQMAVMESAAAEQSLKDSAAALQEEAVTLAVQIQELQAQLATLQQQLQHVNNQQRDVELRQMDAAEQPLGGKQLADQLEAIRQLQDIMGSPDSAGASGHHSTASQALQGCVCSAATSTMQATILLHKELVAKATFARERAAQARQQVQHLTSLGLADKSAAASRTVSSQEQLLSDAVREGSALLQKTAAAGKAANSCLGSMGAEEAAPQGQLLEKLLRDSEELQSQLAHGLPAGQAAKVLQENGHLGSKSGSEDGSAAARAGNESGSHGPGSANGAVQLSEGTQSAATASSADLNGAGPPASSTTEQSGKGRRRRNKGRAA